MDRLALRIDTRGPAWVGLLIALCAAAIGVAAGVHPQLGVEAAVAIALVAAVLANLTLGLCMFTLFSFLDVINAGGDDLSFLKVAGLLLFLSWYAAGATRAHRRESESGSGSESNSRSLLSSHPGLLAAGAALVGWSALSLAWAASPGDAASASERFLLNLLLLPIVFGAVRRREQLLWVVIAFVAGAALSSAIGLLHTADERLTGTIGDANEEAAVLVAGLMLAAGLAAGYKRGSPQRMWAALAGVFIFAGLLGTVSRGGLVASGFALAAGAIFGGRWRRQAFVALLAGAVLVGGYFAVLAPLEARQHFSSSDTTGRADLWKVGWSMFQAHPALGVGAGNFQDASVRYVNRSGPLTRADLIVDVPHVAHNVYLELLDDLGVPGLLAFLATAIAAISIAQLAASRYERAGDTQLELLARLMILAMIGMLAADFFISDQFSKQLWLLFALPPALLALAPRPAAGGDLIRRG
ncbi:MAG TPA: O-antigen ligase family protein [Solirubrobacteraceae bacterium]